MKRFVSGVDRGQSTLLPECLDDFIDESNPVRVIDAFVDALDLGELGFDGVIPEATGRPSYHPSLLLKLYIYGYLNRVQSSRRLEREAGRNVEVMWLLGRLVLDHKTIADFRKDNGPALRKVCARFVELCREMGLLTTASIAIDGSKFKAVNNRDKNFTRAKVERRRAQLEESVARYLSQLDTADRQEPTEALEAKATRLKEKLANLTEEMAKLAAYEERMLASPDQQISLTDPDSRSMATSGRGSGVVGYNVQVAVETEHHLIVTHEVTNTGSDRAQLANIAKQAKAVLQTDKLEAVADRGYFNSPEILACHEAGITVTLPKPLTSVPNRMAVLASRTSSTSPRRMSIGVRPASGCPIATRMRRAARSCGATGRTYVPNARSNRTARQGRSDALRDGSTNICLRRCSADSTRTHKRCARGARRSSTPSARSRRAWARRTSLQRHCRKSPPRWRSAFSPTI
jgi:transposase